MFFYLAPATAGEIFFVASVCFFVCFRDSTISGKQLSCLDETFRIDRQPLTDYAYKIKKARPKEPRMAWSFDFKLYGISPDPLTLSSDFPHFKVSIKHYFGGKMRDEDTLGDSIPPPTPIISPKHQPNVIRD